MKVVHVMERFNPMLGQEINVLSKNKDPKIDLYILTTDSFSIWNISDPEQIFKMDREYEVKYHVTIIRNPVRFEKGEKVWMKGLVSKINEIDPDVIFSHGVEYLSFMRLILRPGFARKYSLVTDTHSLPQFVKGSLFRKVFYSFLRFLIIPTVNRKNIITFYTAEENYHLLLDIYGIDKHLIRPFLIGADMVTFYHDIEARKRIREDYGLAEHDLLVLFTGRLCNAKAPHMIPIALRQISDVTHTRIHLLLIGFRDESYMSKYRHLFSSDDRFSITLLPPVPAIRIKDYFSAADVAVYPAECTLSSLEAQACRLPVIMEENPTNNKRCSKGGLLFRPGDSLDLCEKLSQFINDTNLRKQLAKDGFEYVSKEYNYLENVRKMEAELFNQAAKRKTNV